MAFYGKVFGWTFPDRMPMGEMGDYVFINCGSEQIGAIMQRPPEGPPANWTFYFRGPDVDRAAETVKARGGNVLHGPMTVPGGDRVIIAHDAQGVTVGIVGPGEEA